MNEGTFSGSTNPSFGNVPEGSSIVNAYFKRVNAAGGIDGHPVTVVTCNDQANPDLAGACARQAVSKHVVAVISSWHSATATSLLPILKGANIPFITAEPLTPEEFTNTDSFIIGSGSSPWGAAAIALQKSGCKKIGAFAYDVAAALNLVNEMKAALKPLGASIGLVKINPTQASFAGTASSVESSHYDCLLPVIAPTQVVPVMQAMTSAGVSVRYALYRSTYTDSQLKAMSAAGANDVLLTSKWEATNSGTTTMKQVLADIASAGVQPDEIGVSSWTVANLFDLIVQSLKGSATSASVLDALNKADGIDVGTTAPYSTQHPISAKGYNRLFSTTAFANEMKKGVPATTSEAVDAAAMYGAA